MKSGDYDVGSLTLATAIQIGTVGSNDEKLWPCGWNLA